MQKDLSIHNITLSGISVSDGIGIGKIMVYRTDFDDVTEYTVEKDKIIDEIDRYSAAVLKLANFFLDNNGNPPNATAFFETRSHCA